MIQQLSDDLFLFRDTCNVYVLRDGNAALLIDCGDGGVLDALEELGIAQVEHVLFTHHHREQCQGAARLREHRACSGVIFAAPEAERDFFELPLSYRKMHPTLDDPFSCYGASYLRPPRGPIEIDRTFGAFDDFTWRGHEFWMLSTPGNSPGSMTYLLRDGEDWLAFCGDLMLEGARMHTWFDSEWDYGYGAGLYALYASTFAVERFRPQRLFPSHGEPVENPLEQLPEYRRKLKSLTRLYLRDWGEQQHSVDNGDTISTPTAVPHLWQISPHLYKLTGADFGANFHLLLSDSGHALLVDCGLWENTWLDRRIAQMKERIGLKQIDAVVVTHMHGDHILNAPHLREAHGAAIWTLEGVAELFEHPERFDYSALVTAYNGQAPVKIDRTFARGEVLDWQGFRLTFDWLPGQTEYALVLHGEIDGQLVAFTGDNIFGCREHSGHDALVARNSALLEKGYLYCAEYLNRLQPDLILGGHSVVIPNPAAQIERYRKWAYEMRDALQERSSQEQYEYFFDPYWVRAYPYRSRVAPGATTSFQLLIQSYGKAAERFRVEVKAPLNWQVAPKILEVTLEPGELRSCTVHCTAPTIAEQGVEMLTFDISRNGRRYGEYFDALVEVTS